MYIFFLLVTCLELLPLSILVTIFRDNHPLMTVFTMNCSDSCDSCDPKPTGAER